MDDLGAKADEDLHAEVARLREDVGRHKKWWRWVGVVVAVASLGGWIWWSDARTPPGYWGDCTSYEDCN